MGMETLALAGIGMQGIGSVAGALGQDRANRRAARGAEQHRGQVWNLGQSFMNEEANPFIGDISSLIRDMPELEEFFSPEVKASLVGTRTPGEGFNVGQDALMQLLRADPSRQLNSTATGFLERQVATGGLPFDTSELFSRLGEVDSATINREAGAVRGSAGSLGQRFGSAIGDRETRLRTDALRDIGARNAGIQAQAYEAGQGRAMSAAGGLNQNIMQLLGLRTGAAQALAGNELNLSELLQRGDLANQTATNRAGEFNAGMRLQGFDANQRAQGQRIAQLLSALQLGGGMYEQGQNRRLGAFQTMAGGPSPFQPGPSALPGAFGDMGQLLMMYPFLMDLMKKPATPVRP